MTKPQHLPRTVQTLFSALYINAIWVAACLPVVTAPAATGGLLSSIHQWQSFGERPAARSFVYGMRAVFWRASALGAISTVGATLAVANVLIATQFASGRRVFIVLMLAVLLNATVLTVFALPNAAVHGLGVRASLVQSARLAVRSPGLASAAAGMLIGATLLTFFYPIALLGSAVAAASVIEALRRAARRRNETTASAYPDVVDQGRP